MIYMNKAAKEKLRKRAIETGLGGKVEVDRNCTQCETIYEGNPNSKLCPMCRELGHKLECFHCKETFYAKYKNTKYCPKCVDKRVWQKGKSQPKSVGKKISKAKKKFFKTEYGKEVAKSVGEQNSEHMKKYLQTPKGKKQVERSRIHNSEVMKEKIRSGEFTPNINNAFTHWDAQLIVDGKKKKFRSSWEACFWMCNQHLLYEEMRIPYTDKNGKSRTYIADFVTKDKDVLYEIKPKKYFLKQKHKMDCIIDHCIRTDIKFIWINEYNIINYIDESIFSGENLDQLNKMKKGIVI